MRETSLQKAGATLYIIIGVLCALIATTVLILWNKDELARYWYYFLAGGIILYGLAVATIAGGIKARHDEKMPPWRIKVGFVSALVILATIGGGLGYYAWDELAPKPYELFLRQFAIDYDPAYHFQTQYGDFNQTLETIFASFWNSGDPTLPDGYAWGESYMDRGFVHMLNATKDMKYLWPLLNRTESIFNNSDRNHDGIPGYGTAGYTNGTYVEYEVWDGVIIMPLAQLANIIKNTPALWGNASLQAIALKYIDLGERSIQRWNRTNWYEQGDQGWYVTPPENTTACFNRIDAMGLMTQQVYDFTGNATYLAMVQKMARFLKAHMTLRTYTLDRESREMYSWGYDWNSDNSDTSHACLDVEFAIQCYERGFVFDATDMRRLSHTFVDFVYRGRPSQTATVEWDNSDGVRADVNHTNIFSDGVNGWTGNGNHYLVLRQAWFQLYRYHENTTLSSFVVFRSLEDLIRSIPTRPPYTSLSATYMQAMAAIREMAYVNHEFPVNWL
nr:hypothetical protein [Candidatus Sigynarchaeota archaeon]